LAEVVWLAIHEVEIPAAAGYAVTDSFSLGGHNVALAFGAY